MNWTMLNRAQAAIAQGALTNSKRPESLVKGVYPSHLARGRGCHVWDHQGKKYLDFICGLGTNILGYAHPKVNAAVVEAAGNGASLSLGTHYEVEAAEKLKELIPWIDAVKFLKTGSEACSAALRIARAKTGRRFVLSDGYHGWHDQFAALMPPAIGIPPQFDVVDLGSSVSKIDGNYAAVIVEPVITDDSEKRIEWLHELREACTKHGVMLIFDEVITGFRFPRFSVSTLHGVEPDLICLGKAIANGMPLAAVAGKYSVMNCDEYFVSSSYAGEILSLAAAKQTMTLLQTTYDLEWLWANGRQFLERFNLLWPGELAIKGYPARGVLTGSPLARAMFMQEAVKAGIMFGPSWFLSFPAIEELNNVMETLTAIVGRIKRGEVKIEGELPKSPFAERVRRSDEPSR